jgi:hypothetical protein
MRILVHVHLRTMLRHFEGVILALAERGHTVQIASSANRKDVPPPDALSGQDRIEFIDAPEGRSDRWATRIVQLRVFRDYLRYLERRFDHAPKLRSRAVRNPQTGGGDDRRGAVASCRVLRALHRPAHR